MASIIVTGIPEIDRKLVRLGAKEANKRMTAAARETMKRRMLPEVVQNAPQGETSKLKGGIKVRVGKRSRGKITVIVVSNPKTTGKTKPAPGVKDPWYTAFDEFGTEKIKPMGFFRRAYDSKANATRDDAIQTFHEIVEDIVKG